MNSMLLSEAKSLIVELMAAHHLCGWTFRLDHARKRCGSCNYTSQTISLSKYFIELNDRDEVKNVALHEIAHALAGPGHAHDQHWRNIAIDIGARPQAYAPPSTAMPTPKWAIYCDGCNTTLAVRHRRTLNLKTRACPNCQRTRHRLVWRDFARI